jgi:hypothetical protein
VEALIPIGLAVSGAAAIVFFFLKAVRALRLRSIGVRTTGVITAQRMSSSMHYAHFRFADPLGRPVDGKSDFGTMFPQLAPGDEVPVIYDPADPSHARIDTLVHGGLLGATIGIGAGALFLVMGVLFMTAPS